MRRRRDLSCTKMKWQDREAYVLENDLIRLVTLTGGGHIAELHFRESSGYPTLNPLWVPPWKTMEPYHYREKAHAARYGAPITGRLICGLVGHNLCLDYFGPPSDDEARQGLSLHGEAPSARWRKSAARATPRSVALELSVRLPVAGLRFKREIKIQRGESVVYFKEQVANERKADHFFHWTEHVTLGTPFLDPKDSRVAISATRGRTYPLGYENKALLKSWRDFRWPNAPAAAGGTVDLSRPFLWRGLGFVAAVLLDPRREVEFVSALNTQHRLIIGYCFRRRDFPWTAVWEENGARTEAPWSGRCQARGLEFGSTPFPVPRRVAFAQGPLFDTPHFSTLPAGGRKTVHYVSFLAPVPPDFGGVREIRLSEEEIHIQGSGRKDAVRLPASGIAQTNLV